MGLKNLSEDVLLIYLPHEAHEIGTELKHLNELIVADSDRDVIIDFSRAEIMTSSDLSNLLALRAILKEHGRQLILCHVSTLTKGIFTVAGLDAVFEFAENRSAAMAAIEHSKDTSTSTPSE